MSTVNGHQDSYWTALHQIRERQVKYIRWEDIDPYVAEFHDFSVGDTIVTIRDVELSSRDEFEEGDMIKLHTYTSLWGLDFPSVNEYFAKIRRIKED